MIRYLKKLFSVAAALVVCGSAFAKGITVSIGAGTNWKEKREPQIAVWLEDADGNYIRTLYVTSRAKSAAGFSVRKTDVRNHCRYGTAHLVKIRLKTAVKKVLATVKLLLMR